MLTLLILLFDNNYIIHYLLTLLAALLIYNHPSFPSYCRELAALLRLHQRLGDFWLKLRERGYGRPRVHFKKELEKRNFLEQFKFVRMVRCRLERGKDRLSRSTSACIYGCYVGSWC